MTKYEKTHELIKESILNILQEKSLSKITIYDICEEASINRSTFYNHYKDKYHVLEKINEDFCRQLDIHLKIRFDLSDIEKILISLVDHIDRRKFLVMIDIQENTVNLKKDIQGVVRKNLGKYLTLNNVAKRLSISDHFIEKLFSSIVITFLECSIKDGQTQQNSVFLNNLNHMFLNYYGFD